MIWLLSMYFFKHLWAPVLQEDIVLNVTNLQASHAATPMRYFIAMRSELKIIHYLICLDLHWDCLSFHLCYKCPNPKTTDCPSEYVYAFIPCVPCSSTPCCTKKVQLSPPAIVRKCFFHHHKTLVVFQCVKNKNYKYCIHSPFWFTVKRF